MHWQFVASEYEGDYVRGRLGSLRRYGACHIVRSVPVNVGGAQVQRGPLRVAFL